MEVLGAVYKELKGDKGLSSAGQSDRSTRLTDKAEGVWGGSLVRESRATELSLAGGDWLFIKERGDGGARHCKPCDSTWGLARGAGARVATRAHSHCKRRDGGFLPARLLPLGLQKW